MTESPTGQFQIAGFQTLGAGPPTDEAALSLDEVRKALARLRGGKALGVCNISVELLLRGGEDMTRELSAVLTAVWHLGAIPPDWQRGLVISIWKRKGSRQH